MKKALTLIAVLALVAAFAPTASACDNHAVAKASDSPKSGCGMKMAGGEKAGCGMKGAKGKDGCVMQLAACLEKIAANESGDLVCEKSGTVFAKAVKQGDKTVYQVGDQTYDCKFKAAAAAYKANPPAKGEHASSMDLPFNKKGDIYCECCKTMLAKATKGKDGAVTYAVGTESFDCAYDAFLAGVKSACSKKCGGDMKAAGDKPACKMKGADKAEGKPACGAHPTTTATL